MGPGDIVIESKTNIDLLGLAHSIVGWRRPLAIAILGALLQPAPAAYADTTLAAAVLPTSRSVQTGDTATLFATIINAGSETATGCRIEQPTGMAANFSYQTTNPLTNESTGQANAEVSIPAGGSQSFVVAMTPFEVIASLSPWQQRLQQTV